MGGPVATDQILLVAWTWSEADSVFKLFFGIDPDSASELMEYNPRLRFAPTKVIPVGLAGNWKGRWRKIPGSCPR